MKFRQKPVLIDAIQFIYTTEGVTALREFCGGAFVDARKDRHPTAKGVAHIQVQLLNGVCVYSVNEFDWVIKTSAKAFCVCKSDTFGMTYERVE